MRDRDFIEEVLSAKFQTSGEPKKESPRLKKVEHMSLYDIAMSASSRPEFIRPDTDD